MIEMPNAETHEKIGLGILCLGVPCLVFKSDLSSLYLVMISAEFWIGTYYINPDLDTNSRCRKRWRCLKFIWKSFKHRGILHNPYLWITIFFVAKELDLEIWVIGIVASSLIHILTDMVGDKTRRIRQG